jgi:hypothetical protein
MSNRVIDGSSIFTGQDAGKDGLRKELGLYYEVDQGIVVANSNQSTSYLLTEGAPNLDTSAILPFTTQTLTFTSASSADTSFDQWVSNFKQKFVENTEYIDHYFNMPNDFTTIDAINNYESFGYENLSKNVPPLSLLNIHDDIDFPVDSAGPNGYQMQLFLDQFAINRQEVNTREHMFFGGDKIKDIKRGHLELLGPNIPSQPDRPYNSFIKTRTLSAGAPDLSPITQEILFDQTKMSNKLFAFFKRSDATALDFYLDDLSTLTSVSTRAFTDFISNFDLLRSTVQSDEKFYKDYEDSSAFESQFLRLEMLSRVRDFVSTNMRRSFAEVIVENKPSTDLIIGYKIQKFTTTSTQPIQTTYIMTPKTREYYDSLLSYDTDYTYEVKAIMMVVGSSYAYTNVQENPIQGEITLTFVNRPSLQFLEIPVLSQDMIVTDIPNPPPEVMFYNERGNRDQILVVLDQATLVENSSPDNYPQYFPLDYISQNKVFTQQKDTQIQFSTLYTSNIYEIYRVEEEPKSYNDFSDNLLTTIGEPGIELTDNLFRDTITPRKKYYYLIRTLTNFGIHSNPTRIYEVELIQDSDETYLNYSEFKFKETQNTSNTKTFKKFLQIKPTLQQVIIDDNQITDLSTADNYSTTVVGNDPDLIWGRKFKIRVKSKKTGKKIDLNVTFNLEDENNQPI